MSSIGSVLVAVALLGASAAAQEYKVSFLDTNGVTSGGLAYAINSKSVSAGWVIVPGFGFEQAAWWDHHGTHVLPNLPGDALGAAHDLNDAGVLVGEAGTITQQGQLLIYKPRGMVWTGGQPEALSALMTSGASDLQPLSAVSINNRGQILGWGKLPDVPGGHGFVVDAGFVTDIGSLGASVPSVEPFDMNELGAVVGSSEAVNFFDHAFVWQDGVMTDLHELSGVPGRNSHARAINELGVIVGSADFVADFIDFETACTWIDGVVTNLGSLGGSESFAHAVNDHGTIVGTSITADFFVHAIIVRDGVMTDLNDLIPPGTGWTLANAYDIGNDGAIVGEGFSPAGLQAFRLVPDTDGTFQVYGAGCAGSLGITPGLYGQGFPTSGGSIDLALVNGVGGGLSLLLLGAGTGSVPFKPGCDLQILPLLPVSVTLPLGGAPGAAGTGFWQLDATLPPSLPVVDLTLQAILQDPGVTFGVTVSNPLKLHIE